MEFYVWFETKSHKYNLLSCFKIQLLQFTTLGWYNTVDSLLSSVPGIGEVTVDSENNTITVNTSCEETTDALSNQNITVQVSILYDINCVSC